MTAEFWRGFDPATERAYVGPDGPVRVTVSPAVMALRYVEPTDAEIDRCMPFERRASMARDLAAAGAVIDTQIDVWGWGAENTMKLRRMYGYATVHDVTGSVRILVPPSK